jgi:hypothetical protein
MHRNIALAVLLFISTGVMADSIKKAEAIFEKYERLEKDFNPAVADLYAENALIKNKRTYPTGQVRELTMPAQQYKQILRQAMPAAKLRGDYSNYTNVNFSVEGPGVRITADRFSVLKQYTSPISLLVAPNVNDEWLIQEEISESQP